MSRYDPGDPSRTWALWIADLVVEASVEGQACGVSLGIDIGHRQAHEAAEAAQVWENAAWVAHNVATDPSRTWAPAGQPQRKGVPA